MARKERLETIISAAYSQHQSPNLYSGFSFWDRACYVRHIPGHPSLQLRNHANVDRLINTAGASFEWLVAACHSITISAEPPGAHLLHILEIGTSCSGFNMLSDAIASRRETEITASISSHSLLPPVPPEH